MTIYDVVIWVLICLNIAIYIIPCSDINILIYILPYMF